MAQKALPINKPYSPHTSVLNFYKIVMLIYDCIVSGIKGVTGLGHIVMMGGMLWKGHAHRATTGMTNTTQVLTSLAASLAANTYRGDLTMTGYGAKNVDETVMPILAECLLLLAPGIEVLSIMYICLNRPDS